MAGECMAELKFQIKRESSSDATGKQSTEVLSVKQEGTSPADHVELTRLTIDQVNTPEAKASGSNDMHSVSYSMVLDGTKVRAVFREGRAPTISLYNDAAGQQTGKITDVNAANTVRDAFEKAAASGSFSPEEIADLKTLGKSLLQSPLKQEIAPPTYRCPPTQCSGTPQR